jgi:Mce-associated membrane protein
MPPRPRSPRPRPTPARRPRVAGMAPTVPRPSEHVEDRQNGVVEPAADTAGDPTVAVPAPEVPARPSTPAAPEEDGVGAKAKPKRQRSKPAPAAARQAEPETLTEPSVPEPPAGRTERIPLVAAETPAKPTSKPASKPRRKPAPVPARPGPVEPAEPTEAVEVTGGVTGAEDKGAPGRAARLAAALRRQAVPLLAVAALVLATVAVVAGIQDARLRGTPAAANTALVDVGTTAEVAGQLSDAVETVYSFDFARLDENEKAARDVITPEFAAQFDRLFGEVKARAPQQQAVVSATVTHTAVKEITGDRAVLVAFVDQQATRAAPDAQSQQLAAAGRLTVTGERVDGRWKIAAVTPL